MADKRIEILDTAKAMTGGNRDKDYGSPVQNMQETGALWTAYLATRGHHVHITGEDVANMMVLLKMARMGQMHKDDNYVDASAYQAIAGECSEFERS